ncbi:MAG: DUF1287 domain-containing protein [Oscillospiraceae bacterium]|nr:DUF1287 domain-containing protein [Oscillospiraceae bacterium]
MKRKRKSKGTGVLIVLFALIIILLAAYLKWRTGSDKVYTNADFGIPTYTSAVDMDGDGADDQTDFLQNVRNYLATEPVYESKYYSGGYPDDEYGVCTDVVAFGMLDAGYNLRDLVDEDITAHPERYDIEVQDKNIDFRRVSVLKPYFDSNAVVLTNDTSEIEKWQGGDIVIFEEGHIGVVSDLRNRRGVPLLLHHGSPNQKAYEEDKLEGRTDIVGHYRIS